MKVSRDDSTCLYLMQSACVECFRDSLLVVSVLICNAPIVSATVSKRIGKTELRGGGSIKVLDRFRMARLRSLAVLVGMKCTPGCLLHPAMKVDAR